MNESSLKFTVPGDPFGKERPGATRKGKFVTVYTPKKTKKYEAHVKSCYLREHRGEMIHRAVEVKINSIHSIPKSTSKRNTEKMLNNEINCTIKPDADNIAKCILDPLNGVAFVDDNHVCRLVIEKRYGTTPQVDVEIKEYIPWIPVIDIFPLQFV